MLSSNNSNGKNYFDCPKIALKIYFIACIVRLNCIETQRAEQHYKAKIVRNKSCIRFVQYMKFVIS